MSRRTAIVGAGITGMSCLRFLRAAGDEVAVYDTRAAADAPANADPEVVFGVSEVNPAGLDRVVVSPGVALDDAVLDAVNAASIPLHSDIDLFLEAARAPVYAVTGTNGKSTVTALAGHLLQAAGRQPGVGGNLGEAALDLLDGDCDSYVLELSSFQLERLGAHAFRAATVLNVTDDHLDRHGTMEHYAATKRTIYEGVHRAVANRQDTSTLPSVQVDTLITFGPDVPNGEHWGVDRRAGEATLCRGARAIWPVADMRLDGGHNALNALAALALLDGDQDISRAAEGLATFEGLAHRCQSVACIDGVRFVNDSKATNVGATLAALSGSTEPVVLIAGGDGKGADFTPLRAALDGRVRAVVLLGRDAPLLERTLSGVAPLHRENALAAAVARAQQLAQPGDTVLLSPACSSLDMFANFAERGDQFAAVVRELAS